MVHGPEHPRSNPWLWSPPNTTPPPHPRLTHGHHRCRRRKRLLCRPGLCPSGLRSSGFCSYHTHRPTCHHPNCAGLGSGPTSSCPRRQDQLRGGRAQAKWGKGHIQDQPLSDPGNRSSPRDPESRLCGHALAKATPHPARLNPPWPHLLVYDSVPVGVGVAGISDAVAIHVLLPRVGHSHAVVLGRGGQGRSEGRGVACSPAPRDGPRPPLCSLPPLPRTGSRPWSAPTLRQWRSEQRSFSSGKPSRSVSRPQRSPLPAQPMAHYEKEVRGCSGGPEPRLPVARPFPRACTHHARLGAVTLHDTLGLLVARAGSAVGARALGARAAAGSLVAHEAGQALAALEGALPAGGGRSVGTLPLQPTPCPVSTPSSSPPRPYPGVDAHGVGDAVVLPSLTLIDVRANLGERERSGHCSHADTPAPGSGCPLPATSPLHPASNPTTPNSDPYSTAPLQPLPTPPTIPAGAAPHGPHLLVGLGEGQPHTLVGAAAVPRRTGLAAEARAGVDAADPREAGMGVTLEDKAHGGSEVRSRPLCPVAPQRRPKAPLELGSPRAVSRH